MTDKISISEFQKIVFLVCNKETSVDQSGWSPENPLYGHCAIVALLAQDFFGGEILRASLKNLPYFAHMRSHYRNRLADGRIMDFTAAQFGDNYPRPLHWKKRKRERLLSSEDTRKRYEMLRLRFLVQREIVTVIAVVAKKLGLTIGAVVVGGEKK